MRRPCSWGAQTSGERLDLVVKVCRGETSPDLRRNTRLFPEAGEENDQACENPASFLIRNFYFIGRLRWESFKLWISHERANWRNEKKSDSSGRCARDISFYC